MRDWRDDEDVIHATAEYQRAQDEWHRLNSGSPELKPNATAAQQRAHELWKLADRKYVRARDNALMRQADVRTLVADLVVACGSRAAG